MRVDLTEARVQVSISIVIVDNLFYNIVKL